MLMKFANFLEMNIFGEHFYAYHSSQQGSDRYALHNSAGGLGHGKGERPGSH
jgi:hypothetical protein